MHIKSIHTEVPPLTVTNAYYTLLRRPDQAEWPDFTIHIDANTGKTRTFREYSERVQYAATVLGAPVSQGGLGLSAENGDIIGIMSYNCMDYVTFVHSCLYIATPFALISALSKPFELKHSLKLSKANWLFVDENLLSTVLPIARELGISSKKILIMSGLVSGRQCFSRLVDEMQIKKPEVIPVRSVRRDTLAYLVFSSGTTGLPKAVMISHGNLIFAIRQFLILLKAAMQSMPPPKLPTPDGLSRHLACLPMNHSYGLFTYCFRCVLSPMTLVIVPSWNLDHALDLIPKYKITTLTLIPSTVHQLVHHPKTAKTDLSSVVALNSGAAYLSPELKDKLTALSPAKVRFAEGYGMSESTLTAIYQPFNDAITPDGKSKRGSLGTLAPGMEARIILEDDGTPDGTLAGPNQVGNLWLKGDNIALGYWNNEQATRETFIDGWLKTGDKFWADEDGYFYFADRAKDTLKVSGAQVSPLEIEEVLLAHPQKLILDVTVAGVSGGRTSDEKVPRAWVVLSPEGKKFGASKVVKALDDWQQQNLSKYKWLRGGFEVVKEIPKSPMGKVLRRELQDKYEKGLGWKKEVKSKL
ncbi:hypothetical protein F5887DRAFT_878405 [Amanita rubescens]|nr:hypothetical protein F5887DRAFT_878405 [Amanita rubescens]